MNKNVKKVDEPSCGAIALRRARHARSRSRSLKRSSVHGWVAFISALVGSFAASVMSSVLVASLRWTPAAGVALDWDRKPNDRERGHWGEIPIPTYAKKAPSLQKLAKTLQRPSRQARENALADILARVSDPETRIWLERCVGSGGLHRIQYVARAGSDAAVLAGWRHEAMTARLEAEKEAEEAKKPDPKPGPKP